MYGNYCQIPDIDPYTKDVMKLLKKKSSEPCFDYLPLTTIEQNFEEDSVRIIFHPNVVSSYLSGGISFDACFYQEVFRAGTGNDSDFQYK